MAQASRGARLNWIYATAEVAFSLWQTGHQAKSQINYANAVSLTDSALAQEITDKIPMARKLIRAHNTKY